MCCCFSCTKCFVKPQVYLNAVFPRLVIKLKIRFEKPMKIFSFYFFAINNQLFAKGLPFILPSDLLKRSQVLLLLHFAFITFKWLYLTSHDILFRSVVCETIVCGQSALLCLLLDWWYLLIHHHCRQTSTIFIDTNETSEFYVDASLCINIIGQLNPFEKEFKFGLIYVVTIFFENLYSLINF